MFNIKEIISRSLPNKLISTCFGMGFLPDWQRHWTAALSSVICILYINHKSVSLGYSLRTLSSPESVAICASAVTTAGIIMLIIFIITSFLYLIRTEASNDEIVFDTFSGQFLIFGLSLKAMIEIRSGSKAWADDFCGDFLFCTPWIRDLWSFLCAVTPPFATFRVVETLKVWPISRLSDTLSSPISRSFGMLSAVLYSSATTYLIAFILFDLTLPEAISFMKLNMQNTFLMINDAIDFCIKYLHVLESLIDTYIISKIF